MKEVGEVVDNQIKTQSYESSKSSEAVSKASAEASASPSSTEAIDELDEEAAAPAEPEITAVATVYTETDLTTVREAADKAQAWLDDNEAKQSKLGETDDPVFTVKEIEAEKKKLDDIIMDMMMKKMKHFKPPNQQKPKASKPKSKSAKGKKKASKTGKSATKETDAPAAGDRPSREELEEALRKAGVDPDSVDFSNPLGDASRLNKLNLGKDAYEEEILAALDKATKEDSRKNEGHSEL